MSITYLIQNGDIKIAPSGRPNTIADGPKLKQDLVCDFTTQTRTNGFGAGLEDLVGIVPGDPMIFTLTADQHLKQSLLVMKALQASVPRPDAERIASVDAVYVVQDDTDPRVYRYFVSVTTRQGQKFSAAGTVS